MKSCKRDAILNTIRDCLIWLAASEIFVLVVIVFKIGMDYIGAQPALEFVAVIVCMLCVAALIFYGIFTGIRDVYRAHLSQCRSDR